MDANHGELQRLAERQHGLLTRAQATALGVSRSGWRNAMGGDEWEALTGRVARRTGAPRSLAQRVLAAALDVGPSAFVSHGSGAALWGLSGFDAEPTELIVVRGGAQTGTALGRTHRPCHLPDPFGTVLDGIPVVRPALVLLQLAPRLHPDRLARLLDQMWSRRLVSGASVRRELAPLMHRGRAGTVAMRELLDALPADYVPPASGLEGRFATILERFGIPPMRRQVDLGDDEAWSGRVDFVDRELPLVVEIDSERYHSALSDRRADALRQAKLEAAGFRVRRFTDVEVWHRGTWVAEQVSVERAALRRTIRAA